MKLSTRTRYGTRALLEMALHYDEGRPVQLHLIARRQELSKKYLEQVFTPLREAGVIQSVRGPMGGYLLSRSPEEIRLDEIFRILEGPPHLVDCLEDKYLCPNKEKCPTREIWEKLSLSLVEVLQSISLADLVQRHREINALQLSS